jgi:hypothetical protein
MDAMPHSQKSLSPNFGAWSQNWVTKDLVQSAIEKKETKLPAYQANTGGTQCLLIVIGSLNGSSFELQDNIYLDKPTGFNKVFLIGGLPCKPL